jgi:ribosomal protein S18 acetylase RimI-like enzyme
VSRVEPEDGQAFPEAFRVRDVRVEELDEVTGVMVRSYREYDPSPLPEAWAEEWNAYLHEIQDVRTRFRDAELIVAEQAGRVVGAVTFYPEGACKEAGSWPPGWAAIRLLAVVPEARGRGIGRALTEECLRRARRRGVAAVGLHTARWNHIGRGMYERMGFLPMPEQDYRPVPEILVTGHRLDLVPRGPTSEDRTPQDRTPQDRTPQVEDEGRRD